MSRTLLNLGLLPLTLMLLAACSGGPPPAPTPTTDAEGAYLDGLAEILKGTDELFQSNAELSGPVFPGFAPDEVQARVLFNMLDAANYYELAASGLQIIESLSPPAKFAEDHDVFFDYLRGQVSSAVATDDAIQRRDLPSVHMAMAELQV